MTPSELLTAAADRVRDLAAHFATYYGTDPVDKAHKRFDGPIEEWVYWNVERDGNADARRWIAAMSPAIAPALERLLRDAAKDWDVRARIFTAESMEEAKESRRFAGALALAGAILGSGVDTP